MDIPTGAQLAAEAHAKSGEGRHKKREDVYKILHANGPLTAHELALHMDRDEGRNVYARLSELERELRAERVGVRVNEQTGKKATLWNVVKPGTLPPPPPPKKVPRKALEAENAM